MPPLLYALDFDGVICDSAVETGITGWQCASQLWADMPASLPDTLLDKFRTVRPVMETGFEAILIMRLLYEGITEDALLQSFNQHIDRLITRDQLDKADLKQRFGQYRDQWIERDLDDWITMNPLFEGFADKLHQIASQQSCIITTKQERFVSHILEANGIHYPAEGIFGMDRKLSKTQILADLLAEFPEHDLLFVEDRLQTLLNVIDDERLQRVALYFADWGYNTTVDKSSADNIAKITRLDLPAMMAL